jgi:small subunit ribosomal protein S17
VAGRQKSLIGTVVSDRMEKTVIVAVETTTRHRIYHKIFKRTKRYMAHDDRLGAKPGDQVRILETRPLSRHKRWRVAEVIQRGEVAEVQPKEIDADLIERPREQAPAAEAPAAEAPAPELPAAEAPSAIETVDAAPEVSALETPAEEAEEPPVGEPEAPEGGESAGEAEPTQDEGEEAT